MRPLRRQHAVRPHHRLLLLSGLQCIRHGQRKARRQRQADLTFREGARSTVEVRTGVRIVRLLRQISVVLIANNESVGKGEGFRLG